jgi:hypothetical protein
MSNDEKIFIRTILDQMTRKVLRQYEGKIHAANPELNKIVISNLKSHFFKLRERGEKKEAEILHRFLLSNPYFEIFKNFQVVLDPPVLNLNEFGERYFLFTSIEARESYCDWNTKNSTDLERCDFYKLHGLDYVEVS